MRIAVSLLFLLASSSDAFTSLAKCGSPSRFLGTQMRFTPHNVNSKRNHMQSSRRSKSSSSSSSLNMFLGSDGGILGVGTPELATILLVGYFVLGPSDLYKLVKEIGKAVQNFRTLSSDAAKTFETSMESQIEFDEIRKAQRELNDAFSFRRSINVDQDEEAFTTTTTSEKIGAEPIRGDMGAKKKIRRRKKVIVEDKTDDDDDDDVAATAVQLPSLSSSGNVPDLDMSYAFEDSDVTKLFDMQSEAERVRAERLARLESSAKPPASDWFSDTMGNDNDVDDDDDDDDDMFAANAEAARFQAQLSNWNESILANEDKLSPLSKLMERLALLEEEKAAQLFRLEEEYRERADLEERFYRQKRELLEEAAAEIQASAYVNPDESVSSA